MDQQSLLKINLFIVSDDFWEESEPANSRDSHPNIFFLDTMLSETQCIVSWILTAVYVSFLCQERAGVYSLALCLFSFLQPTSCMFETDCRQRRNR